MGNRIECPELDKKWMNVADKDGFGPKGAHIKINPMHQKNSATVASLTQLEKPKMQPKNQQADANSGENGSDTNGND